MSQKAYVKPGFFLPTLARHVRFLLGFEPNAEIRFVIEGGREFHPISTYIVDGIVYVDLEPVKYVDEGGKPIE